MSTTTTVSGGGSGLSIQSNVKTDADNLLIFIKDYTFYRSDRALWYFKHLLSTNSNIRYLDKDDSIIILYVSLSESGTILDLHRKHIDALRGTFRRFDHRSGRLKRLRSEQELDHRSNNGDDYDYSDDSDSSSSSSRSSSRGSKSGIIQRDSFKKESPKDEQDESSSSSSLVANTNGGGQETIMDVDKDQDNNDNDQDDHDHDDDQDDDDDQEQQQHYSDNESKDGSAVDEQEEIHTVTVNEQSQYHNLPVISMTPKTQISLLSSVYMLVFYLDLSPSMSSIDPVTGTILIDYVFQSLQSILLSLALPFETNNLNFEPSIYVTVMAQGIHPTFKVITQCALVNSDTVFGLLDEIEEELAQFEDQVAQAFAANDDIPTTDLTTMFSHCQLALSVMPVGACPSITIITDAVTSMGDNDLKIFDNSIMMFNRNDIACNIVQVGSGVYSHADFGYTPDTDILKFLTVSTHGSFFDQSSLPVFPKNVEKQWYKNGKRDRLSFIFSNSSSSHSTHKKGGASLKNNKNKNHQQSLNDPQRQLELEQQQQSNIEKVIELQHCFLVREFSPNKLHSIINTSHQHHHHGHNQHHHHHHHHHHSSHHHLPNYFYRIDRMSQSSSSSSSTSMTVSLKSNVSPSSTVTSEDLKPTNIHQYGQQQTTLMVDKQQTFNLYPSKSTSKENTAIANETYSSNMATIQTLMAVDYPFPWIGAPPQVPLLKAAVKDYNVEVDVLKLLDLRIREGFNVKLVSLKKPDSELGVSLLFNWLPNIKLEYRIKFLGDAIDQSSSHHGGKDLNHHASFSQKLNVRVAIDIIAYYEFLREYTGAGSVPSSSKRTSTSQSVIKLQQFINSIIDKDKLLSLIFLQCQPSTVPPVTTINPIQAQQTQATSFLKMLNHLGSFSSWEKWLRAESISVVLSPTIALATAPCTQQSVNYVIRYDASRNQLLKHCSKWANHTFNMNYGHLFVRFLPSTTSPSLHSPPLGPSLATTQTPGANPNLHMHFPSTSFCILRFHWDAAGFATINLLFFSTSEAVRELTINNMKRELSSIVLPISSFDVDEMEEELSGDLMHDIDRRKQASRMLGGDDQTSGRDVHAIRPIDRELRRILVKYDFEVTHNTSALNNSPTSSPAFSPSSMSSLPSSTSLTSIPQNMSNSSSSHGGAHHQRSASTSAIGNNNNMNNMSSATHIALSQSSSATNLHQQQSSRYSVPSISIPNGQQQPNGSEKSPPTSARGQQQSQSQQSQQQQPQSQGSHQPSQHPSSIHSFHYHQHTPYMVSPDLKNYLWSHRWVYDLGDTKTCEHAIGFIVKERLCEGFTLINLSTFLFFKDVCLNSDDADTPVYTTLQYIVYLRSPHCLVIEFWMEPQKGYLSSSSNPNCILYEKELFILFKQWIEEADGHIVSAICSFSDLLSISVSSDPVNELKSILYPEHNLSLPFKCSIHSPVYRITAMKPKLCLDALISFSTETQKIFSIIHIPNNISPEQRQLSIKSNIKLYSALGEIIKAMNSVELPADSFSHSCRLKGGRCFIKPTNSTDFVFTFLHPHNLESKDIESKKSFCISFYECSMKGFIDVEHSKHTMDYLLKIFNINESQQSTSSSSSSMDKNNDDMNNNINPATTTSVTTTSSNSDDILQLYYQKKKSIYHESIHHTTPQLNSTRQYIRLVKSGFERAYLKALYTNLRDKTPTDPNDVNNGVTACKEYIVDIDVSQLIKILYKSKNDGDVNEYLNGKFSEQVMFGQFGKVEGTELYYYDRQHKGAGEQDSSYDEELLNSDDDNDIYRDDEFENMRTEEDEQEETGVDSSVERESTMVDETYPDSDSENSIDNGTGTNTGTPTRVNRTMFNHSSPSSHNNNHHANAIDSALLDKKIETLLGDFEQDIEKRSSLFGFFPFPLFVKMELILFHANSRYQSSGLEGDDSYSLSLDSLHPYQYRVTIGGDVRSNVYNDDDIPTIGELNPEKAYLRFKCIVLPSPNSLHLRRPNHHHHRKRSFKSTLPRILFNVMKIHRRQVVALISAEILTCLRSVRPINKPILDLVIYHMNRLSYYRSPLYHLHNYSLNLLFVDAKEGPSMFVSQLEALSLSATNDIKLKRFNDLLFYYEPTSSMLSSSYSPLDGEPMMMRGGGAGAGFDSALPSLSLNNSVSSFDGSPYLNDGQWGYSHKDLVDIYSHSPLPPLPPTPPPLPPTTTTNNNNNALSGSASQDIILNSSNYVVPYWLIFVYNSNKNMLKVHFFSEVVNEALSFGEQFVGGRLISSLVVEPNLTPPTTPSSSVIGDSIRNSHSNLFTEFELESSQDSLLSMHRCKHRYSPFDIKDRISVQLTQVLRRINQLILLNQLFHERSCSPLLLPPVEAPPPSSSSAKGGPHQNSPSSYNDAAKRKKAFKHGEFACPLVYSMQLPLNERLSPSNAIRSLISIALHPFAITNRKYMFVYRERGGNTFYLKLSEPTTSASSGSGSTVTESPFTSPSPTPLQSPRHSPSPSPGTSPPKESMMHNARPSAPSSSSISPHLQMLAATTPPQQNYLFVEVFGVELPGSEITTQLHQMLEVKLSNITLALISNLIIRNPMLKLTMEDVEFIKPPHVIPTIATIKLPALVGDYMFIQLVKQNFLQFLTLMHLTTGSGSGGSGSGPNPLSSSMVMSKSDDSALAPQTHHHQPGEGLISQHRTLSSTMEIPMSSSMLRGGGGETNAAAGDKYEIKPSDYTFIYNFVASSSSQSALSSIGQGIATITLGCAVSENLIQENESDVPSTAVPVTYIPMTLSSNADSSRKLELIEKLLSGVQVLEVKKERENSSSSPTPLSKSTMSSSSSLDQPQFFDHIQLKIWCRGSINAQALVDKLTLSINQTLTEYLMETVISQTIVTPSSLQSEYLTPVERVMATGRSLSTTSMNEIKLPGQFHLPTYATNDFLLDVKDLINDINSKMHPSLWYTEQQTTNENDEKKPPLVKYSPKRSQQPSTTATGVATAATPSTTNISDSTISIPIVSVEQPNNNNNGLGSSSQSTLDEDSNRINLLNKHNYQLLVIGGKNIQEPVVENTTTTTTMELQLQHQIIQSETTTTTTTTVVSASMTDIASGLMTFTEESISSTSSIISSITGSTNAIVKGPPSSSSQQSVISDDYLYYPHIKDPQLVQPIHRTCSIIATIKANQFYIHTYNWSQSKLDLLQAGLNRIQTWKALRRTLLNNVLHQKMGLFNHVQPHFVNQTISSFFPDARSQSIVRYTYENVDLFVNYPSTPKKLPYSLVGNNPPPASAPRGMIKSSSLTATPAALGLPTPTTPMTSAAPTTNTTTSTTTPANNNTPATAATSTTTTTSTGNKSNSSTPANPTTTTTPSSNQPTAKKSLPEFDTILRDNSIQNTQLLQQPTVLPIIADPVQRYVGQIKALANQVEKAAEAKALFSQARSFFVDTDKSPSKHHLESIIKMSRLVHFRCVPFLYDEYLDGSHSSREQIGNQQTANNPPHLISPALVGIVHAPLKGNALPYLVMSERSLTSQGDWKGKTMEFFLGEYIHYMEKMLQSAKIIITINNDEADTRNEYIATAKRSLRAYLQQTFKGGSLLIKIGFRDLSVTCELFAVLQPTAQGSNLQTTTKNLSNMFAEEYGRFTHELHLNSFVYDFHIRQIYDFLHNNHIYYSPHQKDRAGESPRVNNVSSSAPASPLHHEPQVSPPAKYFVEMMQSLSRYYPKPPAHAFGHLHQSIMSLGVSIEPIYLFEYLTKSVQHYQISHLDEKGIFPALFFSIPGGTTSPDSGSPSFTWDVVVFCLNTKQQDEDGQDQKDMLKLSNNSTTVIPSLIMEDSKYQIQLQYIIIKTATDTTFPRLDHFSPLHPVNNQHLTMPSSSSNTSSTKQHQQQSWNSNPNLSPLPPKHHKESQSHAPSAHHVMNPKSVDHIERANKQMSINEEWVRTKLSKIITKASINFQRDRLWNKLLRGNPYEPALTIAEFSQFTHLVKRKSIKTMDIDLVSPNINLFQNMGHVWVGLCSYLVKTCGDRIRQLHNDADKHLFILNPNVDCLMLELVYNEREKESDAFVCRKEGANNCNLEEIDEQEFLHASQLVNTLCHYLWTELLKSNNTYI